MKFFLSTIVAGCACLFLASICGAEEVEWTPEANMDHQLFPSLIIATATVRPVEPDDKEAEEPDPYLLGERFGLLGVSVKAPDWKNARSQRMHHQRADLMATTSWSGNDWPKSGRIISSPESGTIQTPEAIELAARKVRHPGIAFGEVVDGESAGEKHETPTNPFDQ